MASMRLSLAFVTMMGAVMMSARWSGLSSASAQGLAAPVLSSPEAPASKAVMPAPIVFGPYEYEAKPEDEAFDEFHPMKAPEAGAMLLRKGDRLAILGDSITEQKRYSRMIETYLTVCYPQLEISVRQFGWSGEKTDGMLNRLDQDVLRFSPSVATLSYGMNDARYRPFDWVNGRWYSDHYTAIVRKLKAADVRVVVGSPGCSGKIASWVDPRSGTLQEHNLNLCTLRDICIEIADKEDVRFADVFWPMFKAQVLAGKEFGSSDDPYEVAGRDGIHPGWAGHVIMAYAYLRAMGLDGKIGEFTIDMDSGNATASEGHTVRSVSDGAMEVTSTRYPMVAEGSLSDEDTIRSGMKLVPFFEHLDQFTLKVENLQADSAEVRWGDQSKVFPREMLAAGINLADEFPVNPFSKPFAKVDEAVAAKQAYETEQIKKIFHGDEGKKDIEAAAKRTEAVRAPLVEAIQAAMKPVTHQIVVTPASRK